MKESSSSVLDRCSSSGASWLLVTAELPIRLLLLLVSTLQPAADKTNVQNNLPLTLPSSALLLPSICTCLLSLNIQTRKVCLSVWPGCNWWWFKQVCGLAAVGSGSRGGMRRQRLQWLNLQNWTTAHCSKTSLHHSTQLRHQLCQSVGGY